MSPSITRDSHHGVARSILFTLAVLSPILGIFPSANAQIPSRGGKCPIKNPSSPIDLKKITGQWYEIEASPTFLEHPYKCISIKVPSFYEKKTEISIDAVDRMSKRLSTVRKLSVKIPDSSSQKDGKVTLTMIPTPISPEGELIFGPHMYEHYEELPIQILATDYDNWALVWMCKSNEKAHLELVWVLSRERTLTGDQYNAVLEAKDSHSLEGIETKDTIQWGCTKQEEDEAAGQDADQEGELQMKR